VFLDQVGKTVRQAGIQLELVRREQYDRRHPDSFAQLGHAAQRLQSC
jgi:hypothetical protein